MNKGCVNQDFKTTVVYYLELSNFKPKKNNNEQNAPNATIIIRKTPANPTGNSHRTGQKDGRVHEYKME